MHPAQQGGLYIGQESARSRASTWGSRLEHICPLPTVNAYFDPRQTNIPHATPNYVPGRSKSGIYYYR